MRPTVFDEDCVDIRSKVVVVIVVDVRFVDSTKLATKLAIPLSGIDDEAYDKGSAVVLPLSGSPSPKSAVFSNPWCLPLYSRSFAVLFFFFGCGYAALGPLASIRGSLESVGLYTHPLPSLSRPAGTAKL